MIFLGTTFCSGRYSLTPPPLKTPILLAVQIFDGEYNQVFLSTNLSASIDDGWTTGTLMNAEFSDNLDAGNSFFSLNNTDHIVIRRRELGTSDWIVIHVQEVKSKDDFKLRLKDTYARAGVEYEYSVSSYLKGVENNYLIRNVYSDFQGFYITDKDCLYGTIYDMDGCDTSRNITAQTLELLNSKYMTVVSNSALNCDSGSISATLLKMNEDEVTPNLKESLAFRNSFKDRLANKKPLILKIDDGRIWMIRVSSSPNDTVGGHRDIRKIHFEWIEIGDVNDMRTLYINGFSDVDSRWWT